MNELLEYEENDEMFLTLKSLMQLGDIPLAKVTLHKKKNVLIEIKKNNFIYTIAIG